MPFYDPIEFLDYLHDKVDDAKADLGLRYVAYNDESLLPEYPACIVSLGTVEREYHATRQFMLTVEVNFWITHADLTVDHAERTRADIELATRVRKLLHADMSLGGGINGSSGRVQREIPGVTALIIGGTAVPVVTSYLSWIGSNRVPFEVS